jgi:hypothetical protein
VDFTPAAFASASLETVPMPFSRSRARQRK